MKTRLSLFTVASLVFLLSCKKEDAGRVNIEYQLQTSSITGDHFFVSYLNNTADTIIEHQHPGWTQAFTVTKPFNAYLKAEVNPIDTYEFTIRILVDGQVVAQDSASTASGAVQTISIAYHAN